MNQSAHMRWETEVAPMVSLFEMCPTLPTAPSPYPCDATAQRFSEHTLACVNTRL